ncbi:MAG: S1C family serine protease [Gaiellaceae bacterium]
MRPGPLATVAVVSALLGGTCALALGKAVGWVDDEGPAVVERVVVSPSDGASPTASRSPTDAARPLTGRGFDAAEIYEKRAAGVVTLYAVFEGGGEQLEGTAQGSGFVVSRDGYILTNSHVITTAGEGGAPAQAVAAETVYVEFRDEDRVPAEIVGWDVYDDVGLIKVDPELHTLAPLPLGDSGRVVVGEPVAAIGSPFGNESSLLTGVVSATERSIDSLTSPGYNLVDAIQTDALINRGNSGGPLFNARGEVVGINAQIRSESGNAEGVGFAVPINAARRSMEQLIATGEVRYAWLGVTTQTVTPQLARRFELAAERGAAIQAVVDSSPAADAGLRGGGAERTFTLIPFQPGGDVIVAIDGHEVASAEDVVREITQRLLPGDRVRLTLLRGAQRLDVFVVLGERPATPPGSGR